LLHHISEHPLTIFYCKNKSVLFFFFVFASHNAWSQTSDYPKYNSAIYEAEKYSLSGDSVNAVQTYDKAFKLAFPFLFHLNALEKLVRDLDAVSMEEYSHISLLKELFFSDDVFSNSVNLFDRNLCSDSIKQALLHHYKYLSDSVLDDLKTTLLILQPALISCYFLTRPLERSLAVAMGLLTVY